MGYGTQKPPLGSQLDRGHPLAQGIVHCFMLNEGAGLRFVDSVGGTPGYATSTPTRVADGVGCTGGSAIRIPDGFTFASPQDFTLRIVHRPTTWPSGFTALFDKGATNIDREMSGFYSTSGVTSFVGGRWPNDSAGIAMPAGVTSDYVATALGSGLTAYVNGRKSGTSTGSSTLNSTSDAALALNTSGGGENYSGVYYLCQIWRRALQSSEIAWLYAEPYAMFKPVRRRTYSVPSATFGSMFWWNSFGQPLGMMA